MKSIKEIRGMIREEIEKIASVSVDSGTLMVGDPSYVKYFSYEEDVMNNKSGVLNHKATGDEGRGVVVGGFGGDGSFPVYVEKDEDGLVSKITIDLKNEHNG